MKKNFIWKLLLAGGICPFAAPFVYYFILRFAHGEYWRLSDLLVFWSVIYWPTYVVGLIAVVVSIYKLKRINKG